MLRKEIIQNKEWILDFSIAGRQIILPFSAIKAILSTVTIFAVLAIAYNIGQMAALEEIKYGSYLCGMGCRATFSKEANKIVWLCPWAEEWLNSSSSNGTYLIDPSAYGSENYSDILQNLTHIKINYVPS